MTENTHSDDSQLDDALVDLALSMYVGDICEFCGKAITRDEMYELKMGYKGAAHAICWDLQSESEANS